MSLIKLFNIIDASWVGKFVEKKKQIVKSTNPERIYVENIRAFFGCPTYVAKFLCEMAVKDGLFIKKIGIECGNEECERIVESYDVDERLPKHINCETCEILGREHEYPVSENNTVIYYQLNKVHG